MFVKGQLSSEYLVNLSVIMLVALIVITLVVNANPLGRGVTITQSKNYWASSSPLSISEWKYEHKSLSLAISNMAADKISINQIFINGESVYSTNESFNSGETKELVGTMKEGCGDEAESFELSNVHIRYSKGDISGFIQEGRKPIVGYCSKKTS